MKTSTLLSHENVIEMSWRIAGDLFLIDGLAQQGLILYGATTTEITCFQKNHLSDADFRETVFAAAAKAPIIAAVSVCRIRFIFEPSKHGMKLMDDHDGVVIVVASTRGERRVEVARIFQSGNDVTFGESREWSMSEPSLADEIVAEGVTIH